MTVTRYYNDMYSLVWNIILKKVKKKKIATFTKLLIGPTLMTDDRRQNYA